MCLTEYAKWRWHNQNKIFIADDSEKKKNNDNNDKKNQIIDVILFIDVIKMKKIASKS